MAVTNGAIILGGHVQALGIIRILGRTGVHTIIIDKTRKNIARHSRFCNAFFKSSDDDLLSLLLYLGNEKEYNKWVIFPTNDYHVKLLSINKQELEKYYIISTDKWEVVRIFYNKRYTYKLAEQVKIPFPKTLFPTSENDLSIMDISFPCIIKPAIMHDFYRKTRRKVFLCKNYTELLLYYRKALTIIPAKEIIIQEVIPGSGKNQFSVCFLFLNGETIVSLTACRMRQHPIYFGNATTYAETIEIPEIKNYAEAILTETNYNGLCEVEFKFDERDGQYKFLEVNARTWKWHSIANKSGSPFLKTYFDFLNGEDVNPVIGFHNASFVHWLTDLPVRLKMFLKGDKLWKRKIQPCESAVWARDDIKPWIFEKLYLLNLVLYR